MGPALTLRNADDVVRIVDETTRHADPAAQRKARRMTMLVMIIALGGVFVDAYDFIDAVLRERRD